MRKHKLAKLKNIRWYVYWILDFLKGNPVRKYYNEIKLDNYNGTSGEITRGKIQSLIRHAVETTVFYKNNSPDIDLKDLPIVNKSFYKERYDDFISSKYRGDKTNRVMYTSGSTGTPFSILQDKSKIHFNTAAGIYLFTLGNYFIGTKQALIWTWMRLHKLSRLRAIQENVVKLDCSRLDDNRIREILDLIKQKKIKSIFSYASTLERILTFVKNTSYDTKEIHLRSIISSATLLPENIKKALSKEFSCPVYSMYASEENGIMGIQNTDGMQHYMNSTGYFIEALKKDSDEPAAPGEMARLVITDLYNYAFPVIRYDNGDLAIIRTEEIGNRYRVYMDELTGRNVDLILDSSGNAISPHALSMNMWGIEGINQFQFIQSGEKEYEIRINPKFSNVNEEDILIRLRPLLGEDANLKITYVNEIPVLSTGKRRTFINLYTNPHQKIANHT